MRLESEKMEHRACKEAFKFERDRREESDRSLEFMYDVAQQTGSIADGLRAQLANLQLHPGDNLDSTPSTARLVLDLHLAKDRAKLLEDSVKARDPQISSEMRLLDMVAENDDLKRRLHESNEQLGQLQQSQDRSKQELTHAREELFNLQSIINGSIVEVKDSGDDERRGRKRTRRAR